MKILYLITKSEAGGAQTHVADLCRYFHGCGHEIIVMSSGEGWLKDECAKIGVHFLVNRYFSNKPCPRRLFLAIREIRKCVESFQPEIVHCHSSAAAFLGRLAVRGKIRTIYTAHGWGFNIGMNPFIRLGVLIVEKITARYTDAYICVAEFVEKLGLKYRLAPENKFKVIYNGVPEGIPRLRPDEHRDSARDDTIQMIFVGRLAKPKMPELTIEAIGRLPVEVKNKITFIIIGDGPKRDKLVSLAANSGVNVEFRGNLPLNRVQEDLLIGDAFVFISAWEGLPYTILEACATGLPVIASDVGGISEVVDETNGILVQNNIGQISGAILKLANSKDLRLTLGGRGREIVAQKFSLERMLKKVEAIYVSS